MRAVLLSVTVSYKASVGTVTVVGVFGTDPGTAGTGITLSVRAI